MNKARKIIGLLIIIGISFYMVYPLLAQKYIFPLAEYEIYKSFMNNFLETLRRGELPQWNEYVGNGNPAICLGHYPISQNTLVYLLFGFSDFTCFLTRFFNFILLFLAFIYASKFLGFDYITSLLGSLIYLSVNFVTRFMITDTIGNLLLFSPLLVIFILKIVSENKTRDILIFSLAYILWLSGGHITYVYMQIVMFAIVFWLAVYIYHGKGAFSPINLKKYSILFSVIFFLPLLAVAYQYYFVYDSISISNRLKGGLIAGFFDRGVWEQFWISLKSSSYFWVGLILIADKILIKKLKPADFKIAQIWNWVFPFVIICLFVLEFEFSSHSAILYDYIEVLNSNTVRLALLLYFVLNLTYTKEENLNVSFFDNFFLIIIYISLLSYYFHSPENIIGDTKGYDYVLFRDLSFPIQTLFTLGVLFSIDLYHKNRVVKIMVISLIIQYFIRSHFTIPIMRFTGFVWYATRDGTIFSIFFAILFMYGMKRLISIFPYPSRDTGGFAVKYSLLGIILLLLARDSYNKFYKGTSHRYIYPNKREMAVLPMENWVIDGRGDVLALREKLLSLRRRTKHFFRLFSPENSYLNLAGNLQNDKIYEAMIYDSSIPKEIFNFIKYTILEKKPSNGELKFFIPYFLYTRHVHKALGLQLTDIPYEDFFMFLPADTAYIKEKNIEFLWDLMQVKYLVISPPFSDALDRFSKRRDYKLIAKYPNLSLNLHEIIKKKNYYTLSVLPLNYWEDYEEIIKDLNSNNIDKLRYLYSRLIFLNKKDTGYVLEKIEKDNNNRYYEIFSKQKAVFIEFESWNHNWRGVANNQNGGPQKAFQVFQALPLAPGRNKIQLTYNLSFFRELFSLSVLIIFIYIALLIKAKDSTIKEEEILS